MMMSHFDQISEILNCTHLVRIGLCCRPGRDTTNISTKFWSIILIGALAEEFEWICTIILLLVLWMVKVLMWNRYIRIWSISKVSLWFAYDIRLQFYFRWHTGTFNSWVIAFTAVLAVFVTIIILMVIIPINSQPVDDQPQPFIAKLIFAEI